MLTKLATIAAKPTGIPIAGPTPVPNPTSGENERNQNVGEAAAHPGDENRARKCAFGRLVIVGCCEATRGGHVRHCLDGTRQGDR